MEPKDLTTSALLETALDYFPENGAREWSLGMLKDETVMKVVRRNRQGIENTFRHIENEWRHVQQWGDLTSEAKPSTLLLKLHIMTKMLDQFSAELATTDGRATDSGPAPSQWPSGHPNPEDEPVRPSAFKSFGSRPTKDKDKPAASVVGSFVKPTSSLFSSGSPAPNATTSLFGTRLTKDKPAAPGVGSFVKPTSSLFSSGSPAPNTTTSRFGTRLTKDKPAAPGVGSFAKPTSSLFSSGSLAPNATTSLFGTRPTKKQTPPLFGSPSTTPAASGFGGFGRLAPVEDKVVRQVQGLLSDCIIEDTTKPAVSSGPTQTQSLAATSSQSLMQATVEDAKEEE